MLLRTGVVLKYNSVYRLDSTYYAGRELQLKSKATQVGILQHKAGAESQDMHETFDYDVDEDKATMNWFSQSFVPIVSHVRTSRLDGISVGVVTKARANQLTSG